MQHLSKGSSVSVALDILCRNYNLDNARRKENDPP